METAVQQWRPKFPSCNTLRTSGTRAAADGTVWLPSFQREVEIKESDDGNPSSGLVDLFKNDEHGTLTLAWRTSAGVST